jgi:hypothetical protein
VFDHSGDILNKAQLYDEEKGPVSGSRIIKILVDFTGKVEESLKDIRALMKCIPEAVQPKPEEEKKATGTPGSSAGRKPPQSPNTEREKKDFPPLSDSKTWEELMENVKPGDAMNLDTPPTLGKKSEKVPTPESVQRNLSKDFTDPKPAKNPIDLKDSDEEEEEEEMEIDSETETPGGPSCTPDTTTPRSKTGQSEST